MDIRQSKQYSNYLQNIGWEIKKLNNWNIFIRNLPFYGKFAKLQKIAPPIPFKEIKRFKKEHNIQRLIIEPDSRVNRTLTAKFLLNDFKVNNSPYIPTKTILIDLTRNEQEIFNSFSQAKRRAIRKALKNEVIIEESENIDEFINLKIRNMFPVSHLMAKDIKELYKAFTPDNVSILFAKNNNKIIAGIFLLFYEKKSYYWHASSTKEGNILRAPSLLVFEALKLSKSKGLTIFDFEGVYDQRFPKVTNEWKGFTKFKQGFGGNITEYAGCFII